MGRAKMALGSLTALIVIAAAAFAGDKTGRTKAKHPIAGRTPGVAAPYATLPPAIVMARKPSISDIVDIVLRDRADELEVATSSASDESKVSTVLRRYTKDNDRADRIASALVREGRRRNIGATLLVGVLLTENPWLDPRATSFMGARGLMQVMPFHAGNWGCKSGDLFDIDSNICHGVAILAENLRNSKSLPEALLGYNGCVRGTNTPDCWRYPGKVFRHARNSAAKTGAFPGGLVPFSYPESGPRRIAPGAKVVRRGNILLPKELLVD